MAAESPYVVNTTVASRADEAFDRWNESLNGLHAQYLIAGDAYERICLDLTGFIWMQVAIKMGQAKPPEDIKPVVLQGALVFADELSKRVREVLRGIDGISGQVPDKGDSQS
jgi:hypothetical protein